MDLSIVIPVYNGASYIGEGVTSVRSFLKSQEGLKFEIIVVNDGSSDTTESVLRRHDYPELITISLPENQGKYGAIIAGMSRASGRCRIFTDADIPYEPEAFLYIERLINVRGFHLTIGDRTLAGSEYREKLSFPRAFATTAFSFFVRVMVTGGLFDTQCGLKGFRGDVAEAIFPLVRDRGFSGDVELLYIALKYNLEIKRIPVRLRRNAPSTVGVLAHGIQMLRRISKLRTNWNRGAYSSKALEGISDQGYWLPGEVSR